MAYMPAGSVAVN